VVGDEDEAGAFVDEAAHGFAEVALGGEVEGVGGFVEQELLGPVDEGAGDEDAALFSGGHFADKWWARWVAWMRSRASAARRRISSVTTRLGQSVEAEKNPARTASRPVVRPVELPAVSGAREPWSRGRAGCRRRRRSGCGVR
jgi:hypothetical protein